MKRRAVLALADGSIFEGEAVGASGCVVGEVIFNTSMTGYQEILTDPSYCKQIITLTCPHIGNVGSNTDDEESDSVWASGLVIRESSKYTSNWRAKVPFEHYLQQHNVVTIAGIDTRRLTRIIREKGVLGACIATDSVSADDAINKAKEFPGLKGADLASVVSSQRTYHWSWGSWQTQPVSTDLKHIIVYDFGVKRNILRLLVDRGCRLTVVPAKTPAADVLALKPDGVFLSNGPGDPQACDYAIESIRLLLAANIPLFGICLGHQLLALAGEARTKKMKLGHHGGNHPVRDLRTSQVLISSQNHGFTIDEESLPDNIEITHRSLFDNTIQGICFKDKPVLGFQGHPEASPGPNDVIYLFEEFIQLVNVNREKSCQNAATSKAS